MIKEDEIMLVKALKKGDVKAFDNLFSEYGSRIYHFTYGYLKSKEDAEEVVQEVFIRIWKNRKDLKPDLSFKAYLFKIAYNLIIETFQKVRREQAYKDTLIDEAIVFSPELEEQLNYQALLEKVEKIIDELPTRQKEVLVKKRIEGQSVKDISMQLGITPKTVENHLTEALKNLKKQLGENSISAMLFFHIFITT